MSSVSDCDSVLAAWREEAVRLIPQHFAEFRRLVAHTENLVARGSFVAAAAYGEIAALHAISWHCGLFFSPELERTLAAIGRKAIGPGPVFPRSVSQSGQPRHVLHVATCVMPIGGHSRMLWRWIEQDRERCHSLALTRQQQDVPDSLIEAVAKSGGRIYRVNRSVGSLISWASQLREIGRTADVIVLHIFNDDVIPTLAFAGAEERPCTIFYNHADHLFWLGVGISDVVAQGREYAIPFSEERRAIPAERSALLPIILTPVPRTMPRAQAKRRLGVPDDSVVLLSIARAGKYRTVGAMSFGDMHIPLLDRHKNAVLVVVGPTDRTDWLAAIAHAQGRMVVVGETSDTATYYQAADIYVDSFPFGSTTSLLEAGSCGVPLVSRFPYSDSSLILGADTPALSRIMHRVRDFTEYISLLSRLVDDEQLRARLGAETRTAILETHTGERWRRRLEDVYRLASSVPRARIDPAASDRMFVGEPDVFIQRIAGAPIAADGVDGRVNRSIESKIRLLPLNERLRQWARLARNDTFHSIGRVRALKYLVPEWLADRVRT
jgi:glycosyltransferase involved in cell wall biosynthesis